VFVKTQKASSGAEGKISNGECWFVYEHVMIGGSCSSLMWECMMLKLYIQVFDILHWCVTYRIVYLSYYAHQDAMQEIVNSTLWS
jgi:hypothetical protein